MSTVNVYQALAAVIGDMPAIGKDDTSRDLGYSFRGIESLTAKVQPLLAKHGVIIAPQARTMEITPSQASKHPAMQDAVLHVDWLIAGPDGSSFNASTYGIGRDHTDKAATKAATQAYKYLLLHLLCVSDPKDDGDGRDPEGEAPPDPNRIAAVATYARLVNVMNRPGAKDAIRTFGATHGKGFGEADFDDPEWRALVEAEFDRLEGAAS